MSIRIKRSTKIVLGFSLAISAVPAVADLTSCDVDVYTAYTKAVDNRWQFSCSNATFIPNQSQRAIACVATASPPNETYVVTTSFFSRPEAKSADGALSNGWKISRFDIAGGRWRHNPADVFARVAIVSQAPAGKAGFRIQLQSLTLEKSYGDCTKVYQEAFE